MTKAPGEDAIDGIKVDQQGNLYVSGPGGLWIISPEGNTWAPSWRRSIRIIWPGAATMEKRFI